ncbi:MAG: acyl carrier protein [Patescibacteria group bacterium]|nr:acyl carrier protein [Patescibacteria group bacterium]
MSQNNGNDRAGITKRVYVITSEQLMVDIGQIGNGSSFAEDLGADSLDSVELIMEFEDEFGIHIEEEAAEKISSVGQAIDYIEKCLAQKEP